jgi:hypothetical protein
MEIVLSVLTTLAVLVLVWGLIETLKGNETGL